MLNSFDDISSIANDLGLFQESDMRDIDRRLMILEEENKQLRNLGYFKSEVERLKLELNYANSLKHKYRNMYNEVAVKLMYLQNTDSLIFEEDDQIVNLNKKIEMLVAANEDLKKNYDATFAQLNEERQENARLTDEVIPKLEEQVRSQAKEKERDRDKRAVPRSLSVQKAPGVSVDIGLLPTPRKAPIVKSSPSKAKGKTASASQDEIARKIASVGKNSFKGFYMPSFMRNKRVARKDSKTDKRDE